MAKNPNRPRRRPFAKLRGLWNEIKSEILKPGSTAGSSNSHNVHEGGSTGLPKSTGGGSWAERI